VRRHFESRRSRFARNSAESNERFSAVSA
jgi:hypothetical protein